MLKTSSRSSHTRSIQETITDNNLYHLVLNQLFPFPFPVTFIL